MTEIEKRFFESGNRFFNRADRSKEIDWEERKFEVAKDIYTRLVVDKPPKDIEESVKFSMHAAESLIDAMKNNIKKQ